jgi:hypothetical protein
MEEQPEKGEGKISSLSQTPLTWVPPGHFYSPLVDPTDRHVRQALEGFSTGELSPNSAINIDDREIVASLERISAFYHELPFPENKTDGIRYFYKNGAFEHGDAVTYFGMIRDFRPKRIIEVGSGYSSCVAMDTNDRFFDRKINLTFIEPYPDLLQKLIGGDTFYSQKIVASKVQDVPTSMFETLEHGDILFIDSSHVAKMASDVNDYFFRILPVLARGVIIHIHDILYPFEYPDAWITHENRSWNEAYLLRAFLQYNTAFRVIYYNNYVRRRHSELLQKKMPICLENGGGSIWLKKVGNKSGNPGRARRFLSRLKAALTLQY